MTTETQSLPATPRSASGRPVRQGLDARQIALVFGIALVALLTLIAVVSCTNAVADEGDDGNIKPGVSVNGVSLGGMTRDEAEQALRAQLPSVSEGALTITIGELETSIAYADVQRDYDLTGTLDRAMAYGRDGNSGALELTPAIVYNADELARRVAEIVTLAQAAPVNATINFENGEYVLTAATDGRSVDGAALLAAATAAIANGVPESQTIDVPVTTIPADIGSEAAQNAIAMAQSVTASSLTLTAGESHFTVDTATLRQWVGLEQTAPGQWTLTVDRAAIDAYIATLKAQVDLPAMDAQFKIEPNGDFAAVPGQVGQTLDAIAATDAIYNALIGRGQGTSTSFLTLPVVATEPEFTTAQAQSMLDSVELLGTWTTKYIPSTFNNMGINIRRPADLIDGTVVQPGDTFSFVDTAGPITEANGYGPGAAIIHGKTKAEGVLGGGLCSASTTMYNAALRAGFELGRRSNHAYYITRYPIGLDATIWISGASVHDMTFTNDSQYPVVIQAVNKKRAVTFQVFGISDGRTTTLSEPIITNESPGQELYMYTDTLPPRATERVEYKADGFNAVVTRTVRDRSGNVIHLDTIRSNYRKVDGIVLLGRYPGDPPSGTKIPYGPLPPHPGGGGPTPTPGPTSPPGDTQPVAKFKINSTASPTFSFDAGESTGDGPLTYSWSYEGGGNDDGPTASHSFPPGTWNVMLTVTDADGDIATRTKTVTVGPPPPTDAPTTGPTAVPTAAPTTT